MSTGWRKGLTGNSSSSTRMSTGWHPGWTNPGPQYRLSPLSAQQLCTKTPQVGCKVNTSQQHAIVAKVANSIPPSVSRSVTSRDSKVNLPLHLEPFLSIPGVLGPVLVFLEQYKSIWKPTYKIQFHYKGFCAKIKYIYIMKPHTGYTCHQEKGRF